ncbi:MAG: hypothetical protein CM15mP68_4570 [Pseudomonadota bacterium]|nr:MAG: hypothetical protein CM15mP68_4570 [Pseudomonadota bacterium]
MQTARGQSDLSARPFSHQALKFKRPTMTGKLATPIIDLSAADALGFLIFQFR